MAVIDWSSSSSSVGNESTGVVTTVTVSFEPGDDAVPAYVRNPAVLDVSMMSQPIITTDVIAGSINQTRRFSWSQSVVNSLSKIAPDYFALDTQADWRLTGVDSTVLSVNNKHLITMEIQQADAYTDLLDDWFYPDPSGMLFLNTMIPTSVDFSGGPYSDIVPFARHNAIILGGRGFGPIGSRVNSSTVISGTGIPDALVPSHPFSIGFTVRTLGAELWGDRRAAITRGGPFPIPDPSSEYNGQCVGPYHTVFGLPPTVELSARVRHTYSPGGNKPTSAALTLHLHTFEADGTETVSLVHTEALAERITYSPVPGTWISVWQAQVTVSSVGSLPSGAVCFFYRSAVSSSGGTGTDTDKSAAAWHKIPCLLPIATYTKSFGGIVTPEYLARLD